MAQHLSSRTIHTLTIDIQDDMLSRMEAGDELEVVLVSRVGSTLPKKLTVRDTYHLLEGRR